ncbi:unnamed protein product [Amoebophrya sp. A25]|nr:unnamed protein product [Amoebophrya sp. A25]|eukprot:GSA25T00007735001.1
MAVRQEDDQGDLDGADKVSNTVYARVLGKLREKYTRLCSKPEWWFVQDEVIALLAKRLHKNSYAFVDGFLSDDAALGLRAECQKADAAGCLKPAGLVNGRIESKTTGESNEGINQARDKENQEKYVETSTRGDRVAWFDTWSYGQGLDDVGVKIGTLLEELKTYSKASSTLLPQDAKAGSARRKTEIKPNDTTHTQELLPDLHRIDCRSHHMVACYPGGGARYTKHYDNDGRHPQLSKRVLTTLVYLNKTWNGGELCVFDRVPNEDRLRAKVAPRLGRLLLFFSDTRIPHEVLPSQTLRYSVTAWYLDAKKAPASEPSQAADKEKSQAVLVEDAATNTGSESQREVESVATNDECDVGLGLGRAHPDTKCPETPETGADHVGGQEKQDDEDIPSFEYEWVSKDKLEITKLEACPVIEFDGSVIRVSDDSHKILGTIPVSDAIGNTCSSGEESYQCKWSGRKHRLQILFNSSSAT